MIDLDQQAAEIEWRGLLEVYMQNLYDIVKAGYHHENVPSWTTAIPTPEQRTQAYLMTMLPHISAEFVAAFHSAFEPIANKVAEIIEELRNVLDSFYDEESGPDNSP